MNRGTNSKDKYMLVTWYWDDGGDYPSHASFNTEMEFVTAKQLDDIAQLMKDNGIKRWVANPEKVTSQDWVQGDGSIIEFRNVTIKPIKIVETWGYQSEVVNGQN